MLQLASNANTLNVSRIQFPDAMTDEVDQFSASRLSQFALCGWQRQFDQHSQAARTNASHIGTNTMRQQHSVEPMRDRLKISRPRQFY
jgi:hypothetical protein